MEGEKFYWAVFCDFGLHLCPDVYFSQLSFTLAVFLWYCGILIHKTHLRSSSAASQKQMGSIVLRSTLTVSLPH